VNLRSACSIAIAAACISPAGCDRDPAPRVISAEILDHKGASGQFRAGETIRITFDRPLPARLRPDDLKLSSGPPRRPLLVRALPPPPRPEASRPPGGLPRQPALLQEIPPASPATIDFEILSTPAEPLQPAGIFERPDAAGGPTGIGVDLGRGTPEQWVDLQERRAFPVLLQAIWEDRPPEGTTQGNLVVDQGDWIRLIFDREVKVFSDGPGRKESGKPVLAQVPADLLLASPDDQLDDGAVKSVFLEGPGPREARVVLGSSPRLVIAGRQRADGDLGRSGQLRPSAIAVNGTPIQPSARIADRRGWPGAISRGPVDIEFPPGFYFFEKRSEEVFPPPGHRTLHTVTAIAGGRAVIAGGRTWPAAAGGRTSEGKALAEVLLYNPDAPRPIQGLGELSEPRYLHTANLLPGEDGIPGTLDDLVVIAGGTDGNQSLSSIAAVKLDPAAPDHISIEALEGKLRWPRMYHTATAFGRGWLFIDGGRYSSLSGEGGIIPGAELLLIDSKGAKAILKKRWDFPGPPRMRHSATYLGRGADGAHYILEYGGFGLPPDRGDGAPPVPSGAPRAPVVLDQGMVLAAPELVRVAPGGGSPDDAPRVTRLPLDYEFRFEMLRYDHRAAAIGFDPYLVKDQRPREVLIAGGSLQPPNYDADRPGRNLYEPPPPRRPEDVATWARGPSPPFAESAAAILFEFNPADPERSQFRVIESPTGDRRVHFALAPLAYPGVLILGGENPQRPEEAYLTAEIYLPREKRLAPLAVPLSSARTRFGALVIDGPEGATVHVLGGLGQKNEEGNFTDSERLKLDWR
jgi:hypothetical protein